MQFRLIDATSYHFVKKEIKLLADKSVSDKFVAEMDCYGLQPKLWVWLARCVWVTIKRTKEEAWSADLFQTEKFYN